MGDMVITLLKVRCEETTDDFLEGLTDEFGWRLQTFDRFGDKAWSAEEIPMAGLEAVEPGSEHAVNRELGRFGPDTQSVELEFWDRDTFSSDDLLGRVLVRRGANGLMVSAGQSATDMGGGCFRLTGEQGDYRVWLDIREA